MAPIDRARVPRKSPAHLKPPRAKPGQAALREIRKAQRGTELLIRKAPFERVVREIAKEIKSDIRFRRDAIEALQVAAEDHIISRLSKATRAALHSKRSTVTIKDMGLVEDVLNN
eukprot:IDg23738t1